MEGYRLPLIESRYGMWIFLLTKIMAIVILVVFLLFAFNIARLWLTYLPQMEEAAEETARMLAETGGGGEPASIIQGDIIPELRMVLMLSLILFGLLDGIYALMLWRGKPPFRNESVLIPLTAIYFIARIFHTYVITIISTTIVTHSNPRILMNSLYLTIPIFSVLSLVIIIIVYNKVLKRRKKGTKILFKIPSSALFFWTENFN